MATRRCIYCLHERDETEFNREHVVPQGFGTFENNLVLDCVCTDCNTFFGNELDLKLARDTAEGLDRFRWGLRRPDQYKSLGARGTTRIEVMEDGPLKGVYCRLRPTGDGTDFDIEPLPQVGFATAEDGPHQFFLLDRLPTPDELVRRGFRRGEQVYLRVWGTSTDVAFGKLAERGFKSGETTGETNPTTGRTYVEFVFRVSHPEFRAVTKVALNYLAHVAGAGIARMPNFNEARRYVRADVRPEQRLVNIGSPIHVARRSTGQPVLGHFVTVERSGGRVIAQVSLLGRFR